MKRTGARLTTSTPSLIAGSVLVSAMLLTACSSPPPDAVENRTRQFDPQLEQSYGCESGEVVSAAYPSTDSAILHYKGTDHVMQLAVSASGARYVADRLEWWTRGTGPGSEGSLFRHSVDGTTGELLERCRFIVGSDPA